MGKKIKRTNILTISIPNDVAEYLKSKKKKSRLITELLRAEMKKEALQPAPASTTPEEAEIREALEERERLVKDVHVGSERVWDFEMRLENDQPIDWNAPVFQNTIGQAFRAYLDVYKKYHPRWNNINPLWSNVEKRFIEEQARKRELYLSEEVTGGMTRREILETVKRELSDQPLTISAVVAILGLPYMQVYNKILPFLRREGFEISSSRN